MDWQFSPYAVPLAVGAIITLGLFLIILRRRGDRGSYPMLALCLMGFIYTTAYIFELSSTTVPAIRFWLKVEYLGVVFAPVAMFALIMAYTGHSRALAPFFLLLLSIIPLCTLFFAWTSEHHSLVWSSLRVVTYHGKKYSKFDRGIWYWVQISYFWLLFLISTVALVLTYRRQPHGLFRQQIRVLFLGLLAPLVADLAYITHLSPPYLDINPFGILLTAIAFAWAIFQYDFFDLMPVVHRTIFTSMQDAVLILDSDQRVADLNPAAQRTFDLPRSAVIGLPVKEALSRLSSLIADEPSTLSLELEGQERSFDVRFNPLPNRKGLMIVLHDVTNRRKAEMALEDANARLAMLRKMDTELSRRLDVKYVAVMALDAAVRFSMADAGFIGLSSDEGVRVIHSVGFPKEMDPNKPLILNRGITARVMRTGAAELVKDVSSDPDYLCLISDMKSQISAPLISSGKLIGVITLETADPTVFTADTLNTINQLTARVSTAIDNSYMYEEREKLIKDLDAFAHTVAHDLKNPLSVLYGYSCLLLERAGNMPQQQFDQTLNIIAQTSEKMTSIVNELLLLASIRRGVDVKARPVEMGAIVSEVQRRLAPMIADYDAEVITPDHWPSAMGYGPWLEEVWVNYISNAMKYGGVPPRVELGATEQSDGMIRFWVRDNGEGLTLDQQTALFTEFSRLHQVTVEGHGLGLSIVQRIVEKLHGKVGVESQPGQGSVFSFTLPAVAVAEPVV